MSPNVRKGKAYTDLNYEFDHKTLDVSAISFHRTMRAAVATKALAQGASVLALSYIAAQRVFPDYNDMADTSRVLW
ncbi:MAG: SDR family oxidoreductase [Bacteroidota bacterium]